MDDAARVGGGERVGDGHADLDDLPRGDGSATQALAKVLAIEELRNDVRLAVGRPDVEDAEDIGMRKEARRPGFNLKPAQTIRIGGKARRQGLDRDIAPESGIARAMHLAHAAGADEAEYFVGTEPGADGNGHSAYSPPGGVLNLDWTNRAIAD